MNSLYARDFGGGGGGGGCGCDDASLVAAADAEAQLARAIHDAADKRAAVFTHTHSYGLHRIPADIRALRSCVEFLRIESCFELAALPVVLGELSLLRWLNVSYNRLTALPPELAKLGRLERLHASNNALTHVPIELWALKGLEELRLDSNRLRALPTGILFLPKLRELFLEGNPLLTPDEVDGADIASLFPAAGADSGSGAFCSVDCSSCFLRFSHGPETSRFVTFHRVRAQCFPERLDASEPVPFLHHACSARCEAQLRARLLEYDDALRAESVAATSPARRRI